MSARWLARLLLWVRNEARLIGLDTWATEYHGPAEPHPCSSADPRCVALAEKQARARAELRRLKRGLADGREVPEGFLAHTDVAATFDAIKRLNAPPVRLIGRRAK